MDAHGQIGPTKGNYAADVRRVAAALQHGPVFVKLAERGTAFELIIGRREHFALVGTDKEPSGLDNGEWIFIGRLGRHGCGFFKLGGYLAPDYVADHMNLKYIGDAEILAEFVMRLGATLQAEQHVG